MRALLDGSEKTDLQISGALDITVDHLTQTLYWVNSLGRIEASDFNGNHSSVGQLSSDDVPTGVAVFGDYLYVTLGSSDRIARVDKLGRGMCVCVCAYVRYNRPAVDLG